MGPHAAPSGGSASDDWTKPGCTRSKARISTRADAPADSVTPPYDNVRGRSDARQLGQPDEVALAPRIVAEVHALDAVGRELVVRLARLDRDPAVAEHDLELAEWEGGRDVVLAGQRDGDGGHGGRERVQVVVRLHGREHEVRPEPGLLLVAAGVREHGSMARMERRMMPQQRSAASLLSCTSGTE